MFIHDLLEYLQIVFSEAWWIGKKDENPEEARLDFPKELTEVDFCLSFPGFWRRQSTVPYPFCDWMNKKAYVYSFVSFHTGAAGGT